MPLQLNAQGQEGVFRLVEQALGRSLRQRSEGAELLNQGVGGAFEFLVGNDLGDDAPLIRLAAC